MKKKKNWSGSSNFFIGFLFAVGVKDFFLVSNNYNKCYRFKASPFFFFFFFFFFFLKLHVKATVLEHFIFPPIIFWYHPLNNIPSCWPPGIFELKKIFYNRKRLSWDCLLMISLTFAYLLHEFQDMRLAVGWTNFTMIQHLNFVEK